MQEPIDRKFKIRAICQEHDHVFTEYEGVMLLAKDNAAPATLRFYREECARQGAGPRQLRSADLLIERVDRWRADNPDRLKVPDVDASPQGDRILEPNEPSA